MSTAGSPAMIRRAVLAVLATGLLLPGCYESRNEPLLNWHEDAGVNTCEPKGGTCTARPIIELYGPCGLGSDERPGLECPQSSFEVTGLTCCFPKPPRDAGDDADADADGDASR
jgi:hypothetical protein